MIGIHAVVQVANKAADIQGISDPTLIPQLLGHLFEVQMARYQSKYLGVMFPENSTYTPPTLPVHMTVQLGPVTGAPSEEEIGKVHEAIRLYQQFANAPSLFDPRVDMELHQHLFDIQMARYRQRARSQARVHTSLSSAAAQETNEAEETTNNAGTGDSSIESRVLARPVNDAGVHEAIERSNRFAEQTNQLAERANLLIEQSNRISERVNQLLERPSRPVEQPNTLAERFNGLFERLNQHMEESNRLTKESTQPVEKLGDILRNMNRVLVKVQHAIVRNHKGNNLSALNCLANEKGETPAISETTSNLAFDDFLPSSENKLPIVIDGISHITYIHDGWLGEFVQFYGIADGLCEGESSELKRDEQGPARERLGKFLTSCLG
ncbi:putative laminin domain protein [Rhizoctonia solani 123E]|uniref:Putative laminin domain protein n=1 Tax=Rhizoctonia solani 123E TaxID=1423351 RepID=A0A074SKF4_9AGAM|nr:putative laminin domain protein [Rhizoctonia solani 123E]